MPKTIFEMYKEENESLKKQIQRQEKQIRQLKCSRCKKANDCKNFDCLYKEEL